jgi:murein tripeptide amidase MpaA
LTKPRCLCQANFLAAEYGAPNWSPELEAQYDNFCTALVKVNPDFQTDPAKNYPRDGPGEANMSICASQITARFNCFAGTLEQPFIDTEAEFPQPETGWSPTRSKCLGASLLDGFATLL